MFVEQPTLLIVDDEKSSRKILTDLLKDRAKIVLAKNAQQALDLARTQHPTLILMDIVMPDMDGFQVLEQLKQDDCTKDIAVMFITALGSRQDEAQGLRLGACDYIHKPFHAEIVQARVNTHLALARQRRMLEELVNLDALTAIPNRRQLESKLDVEWANAVRARAPLTLCMIDVDYFKRYNDQYGHAAGDRVLCKVAATLEAVLKRPRDMVFRYGGEEFCVLLPETEKGGAHHILEACRQGVEMMAIEHCQSSCAAVVTISLGAAVLYPKEDDDLDQALAAADALLYQAKQNGRNQLILPAE